MTRHPATMVEMLTPDPLVISWQGRQVRVCHDDRYLTPYSAGGTLVRSCLELDSDVEGLRLVPRSALGHRYDIHVDDDGSVIPSRGRRMTWRRRRATS